MAGDGNWIKLHRKSLDSRVFSDARLWQFWCWLLMSANWKPSWFAKQEIGIGQIAFSQSRVADEVFEVHRNTVGRWLTELHKWGMIEREKRGSGVHQFTVVTICNWKTYQVFEKSDVASNVASDVASDVAHPKKEKKLKKEGAPPVPSSLSPSFIPEDSPLPYPGQDFRDLWLKWCLSRKKARKPITELAAEQQIAFLKSIGEARAVAALKHSISGSYQGIFEPRAGPNGKLSPPDPTNRPLPAMR